MTSRRTAAQRPAAIKVEEVDAPPAEAAPVEEKPAPVEEKAVPAPVGKVVFVPSQHSSSVQTPSGATFTLAPQTALKMTRTDAEDLAAAGFGYIQGD